MWFKNKETGIQWDVTDIELIKRLEKNANYEIVEFEKTEVIESPQTTVTTNNTKSPEKEQVK